MFVDTPSTVTAAPRMRSLSRSITSRNSPIVVARVADSSTLGSRPAFSAEELCLTASVSFVSPDIGAFCDRSRSSTSSFRRNS